MHFIVETGPMRRAVHHVARRRGGKAAAADARNSAYASIAIQTVNTPLTKELIAEQTTYNS
jgi:hypothetical protein